MKHLLIKKTMKMNLKMSCALAGTAWLYISMMLPATAQSHGGGARGGGGHANSARISRAGRYDGGSQRGGPGWWGWGTGLGFGWDGAYYYGGPYAWSPGYYAQYDSSSPIDLPAGQVLPPAGYAAQPLPPVTPNWYYCASARNYYPYINQCPEAWRVVPAVPAGVSN